MPHLTHQRGHDRGHYASFNWPKETWQGVLYLIWLIKWGMPEGIIPQSTHPRRHDRGHHAPASSVLLPRIRTWRVFWWIFWRWRRLRWWDIHRRRRETAGETPTAGSRTEVVGLLPGSTTTRGLIVSASISSAKWAATPVIKTTSWRTTHSSSAMGEMSWYNGILKWLATENNSDRGKVYLNLWIFWAELDFNRPNVLSP